MEILVEYLIFDMKASFLEDTKNLFLEVNITSV